MNEEFFDSFFKAVERMRMMQKEYFRTRSPFALQGAKRLEKQADALIKARQEQSAGKAQMELG